MADDLLAAVLLDPAADLPRLVYADALDDSGQPDRAEFIRVQCGLAHAPDDRSLKAREQTLLALHAAAWLAPLRAKGEPLQNPGTHGEFGRGFVEKVWMPAGVFVRRADTLFRRTPARSLRVTRADWAEAVGLARHPLLGRLGELILPGPLGDNWALQLLVEAPADRLPPVLGLRNVGLSDEGARRLGRIPDDWRPAELDVSLNPLSEAALGRLRDRFGAAVRFDR